MSLIESITEILLKVTLNTINQTLIKSNLLSDNISYSKLWKNSFNSDSQQFHQYQENEQSQFSCYFCFKEYYFFFTKSLQICPLPVDFITITGWLPLLVSCS